MNPSEIEKVLKGLPEYRLKQAKNAIYLNLISDWDSATDLPKETRERLKKDLPLTLNVKTVKSKDKKTIKARIRFNDIEVETVLMSYEERKTVCVSTQAGCAFGCLFCATGKMGLLRNLTASEIVAQVLHFGRKVDRVSNIVFMGMGEPFMNYDQSIRAAEIINEEMNIGARNISFSTVGIPEKIKKFANEKQFNLAISLHCANQRKR